MDQEPTPIDASLDLAEESGSDDAHRIRRFTGSYYDRLGWLAIATMAVSAVLFYWTDYFLFDLSFLIWFWLGRCLKEGNPTARKWAIAFFVMVSFFSVVSIFAPDAKAKFGNHSFDKSHPAYFMIIAVIWIIFAIPGIMLLSRRGREEFRRFNPAREKLTGEP